MKTIAQQHNTVSTHSRPKAAGAAFMNTPLTDWFQHTAARRRLVLVINPSNTGAIVSTHSRPKAAGTTNNVTHNNTTFQHTAARRRLGLWANSRAGWWIRFNTQPPEGGWEPVPPLPPPEPVSTHSRPKAAGFEVQL